MSISASWDPATPAPPRIVTLGVVEGAHRHLEDPRRHLWRADEFAVHAALAEQLRGLAEYLGEHGCSAAR
jgi:hypothetical protein